MPTKRSYSGAAVGERMKKKAKYIKKNTLRKSIVGRQPFMTTERTFWLQLWSPSTATTAGFWQYWVTSLQQLPNYAQYTSVFDKYKINSIKFSFRPRYDNFAGNDTTDVTLPGTTAQGGTNMHVIIDPTSNVTPSGIYDAANLNVFLENGRVRSYTGNEPIEVLVKYPCVAEDTNTTANARYERSKWYSTNLPGVQHRGLHAFLQDTNLTGVFNQAFDVFVTMNVSFAGMK